MAQFPSLFYSLCWLPFVPPLCPLLLTWHPPAVTGIVHLSLRLLVNWPHLPHPSPNCPTPSKFPEPQLPSAKQRRPREYSGSCYPEQLICIRCDAEKRMFDMYWVWCWVNNAIDMYQVWCWVKNVWSVLGMMLNKECCWYVSGVMLKKECLICIGCDAE